jgi:predicted Mrr-cat superfamily restriction endonuclease
MTINDILKQVDDINTESDYWFVRTDYGAQFENFLSGKYIAIGWDYITLYQFRNSTEDKVKESIASREDFDISSLSGKIKATTSYNKIQTFLNLKKDDIVVIPSRNSDRLAFGRIIDDQPYDDADAKAFLKRRKVEWFEVKYMDDLNPIFFQVKTNQHTISSINRFAPHIDRVIGNLFKKGDKTHYVLNIEQTEDINFDDLTLLMDNIKTLVKNINNEFEFGDDLDEFYVKISLQSKGSLELIRKGKSLAVLAYIIFLSSCGDLDNEKDKRIQSFIDSNRRTINSTSKVLDTLKANKEEFNQIFENGN